MTDKSKIYSDNKGKALVYRWVNTVNNKSYVGSTVNAYSRFYRYFNVNTMKNPRMIIYSALIKYGFTFFRLEILEHCERKDLLAREQYYLDLIKPEYNMLKVAGSSLGFKHDEKTITFFKNERKLNEESKSKLSLAASSRVLTELEKEKLSNIRLGKKLSEITRKRISESITSQIGVSVIVKDLETQTEKSFDSLTRAAEYLGVSRTAVKKCCDQNSILKKKYEIKLK